MAAAMILPQRMLSSALNRPPTAHLCHFNRPLRALSTNTSSSRRPASSSSVAKAPPPVTATTTTSATTVASTPAISFVPAPSNDPPERALPAPVPDAKSLSAASQIFTAQRPRILYSASRFLTIPPNTHTPEVCLLGRSNVGKSTLINALAGVDASAARRAHGLAARGRGLAITSRTAGSTRCMNAYGFGAATKQQRVAAAEAERERKARALQGAGSRADRRAAAGSRLKEPPPQHRLVVVDMPGYGLGSEAEWGVEIEKFLAKRRALRGAVFLVDAVAGVKDADRMVLRMLRDAEVRTAVVLTKVDKLVARDNEGGRAAWGRVEEVCMDLWDELRRVEMDSLTWIEGGEKGWQSEIWVTSAGDPGSEHVGLGVAGARYAICRMAGLVEDLRGRKAAGASPPKIVPFDQIQWASPSAGTQGESQSTP